MEYTAEELTEFDGLTHDMASRDQVTRVMGRTRMRRFIDTHGKAKCDAMWEFIKKRDKIRS